MRGTAFAPGILLPYLPHADLLLPRALWRLDQEVVGAATRLDGTEEDCQGGGP